MVYIARMARECGCCYILNEHIKDKILGYVSYYLIEVSVLFSSILNNIWHLIVSDMDPNMVSICEFQKTGLFFY